MNTIKDISKATKVILYPYNAVPITYQINQYVAGTGNDILDYNELFKRSSSTKFSLCVMKYYNQDPEFTLIKLFKPPYITKIEFFDSTTLLDTLYFYTVLDNNLIVYDNIYYQWTILRFEYSNFKLDKSAEEYIHELDTSAHQNQVKEISIELYPKSLVNKSIFDDFYSYSLGESINSTIITKEYQLLYLGNMIDDEEAFDKDDYVTEVIDSIKENKDININVIMSSRYSKSNLIVGTV